MAAKGAVLGLERRESEKKTGREPLQEVASLNEKMFFTRSRRSREGFAIFLLDQKEQKGPGVFADAPFSLLYGEYATQFRSDEFVKLADQTLENLQAFGFP